MAEDVLKAAKAARRTRRAFQTRRSFPRPVFVRAKGWHLSEADVQINGLSGKPGNVCEVPSFPPDATPQEQLQILYDNGYELVRQHE
jgi:hypothetical protein